MVAGDPLVEHMLVDSLSFTYGKSTILDNIDFRVKAGEIIAIIGPSGCGKTTLLNILSGHCKPTSGSLHVEGSIRTVYQQGGLFPWLTVAENIGIGLRKITDKSERDHTIDQFISLVNMQGYENYYPDQLSGGMKQRVELGRAFAGESDIILMDEPFSALDYQARIRMRKELITLLRKKPKTVLLVTHDIEEAVQLADRVLVLSKRPASICQILHVDLPHPRCITHPYLVKVTKMILNELKLED